VKVTRATLRGLRFRIRSAVTLSIGGKDAATLERELDSKFQQHGAAFGLALLDVKESPAKTYSRRLEAAMRNRSNDPGAAQEFAVRCAQALRRARVPDALGVFLPQDPDGPTLRQRSRELELALLARRSGFLYLPDRPFDASLISWSEGTMIFPEGSYE
jgi:hypothetical protein